MFAFCPRWARYGILTTLSALAVGACSDPTQTTDLRPEGPPDVLAVMVMNDAANGLAETATYCRSGDKKRPSLVGFPDGTTHQVCPVDGSEVRDAVGDANPQGWFVRIMFDELLDPSIEDLTEILDDAGQASGTFRGSIARTKPVTLKCTTATGSLVDVPYDGYYSPAGNSVTWPLGPSLVIKPTQPSAIPTQSRCEVTINDAVHDKNDAAMVPSEERGPYAFSLAPIRVMSASPADQDELDGIDAGMSIVFNTSIDGSSIDDTVTWAFEPDLVTTPAIGALVAAIDAAATSVNVDLGAAPALGFFAAADSAAFGCKTNVVQVCNLSLAVCSATSPCPMGDACETTKSADCDTRLVIDNEQMHLTHVDFLAASWTVTRGVNGTAAAAHAANALVLSPMNNTSSSGGGAEIFISGDFKAGTSYRWTIPEGTTLVDRCGAKTIFGPPSVDDQTDVEFTIKDLAFTGITPTDGAMAANPGGKIQLKFNQPMNPDSLSGRCSVSTAKHCFASDNCPGGETCQGAKFTLVPAIAAPVVKQDPSDPSQLIIYGQYQLATQYVFTIPANTTIAECPGGETADTSNGCDIKDVTSITLDEEQSVAFRTASSIVLTESNPADNAADFQPHGGIRLAFNQEMDPASLVQGTAGFDIAPPVAMAVQSGGAFGDLDLRPTNAAGFTPGTYTFTLHAGAQIKDLLGNIYTQPSDLVVHFTVQAPEPTPDCIH